MIIGIVADSHDNLYATAASVRVLKAKGVERILHAGDIVAPFTAKAFLEVGVPVDAVFGNNDGERAMLSDLLPGITEGFRRLEIDGKTVLLVHEREALPEAETEGADLVVFGHTHAPERREVGTRVEINPGECGGWLSGRETLALWDTRAGSPEILEIGNRTGPAEA
ncbi:MAG: metallophosphoesterase [Planctomycetota bacterium]|jgi:putative phosphoesterase